AVNVSSLSGTSTLTLDDSGDTPNQTFTITNSSITGTGFTGPINYSHVSTLTLDGGSGFANCNVQSTASKTTTNLLLQTLGAVKVGSLAPSLGGTLANIPGPLNVSNASVMAAGDRSRAAAPPAANPHSSAR